MTIYRGPGGTGSASSEVDTTEFQEFLVQAQAAKVAAEAARDAALAAETNAELAEVNAETAETNAEAAASAAASSASAAATSASNAASSASAAATSASEAAASAAVVNPANIVYNTNTYANPSWLTSLAWSKITGTPTTIAGYGITNAYTKTEVDASLATKQASDTELTTLAGMSSNRATFLASNEGFGFRNRIINGDMRIDQRNAGASVTINAANIYCVDRIPLNASGGGVFSAQQSSTAPAGFTNSIALTVTTPDSSIGAVDNYWLGQKIEGYNVSDLGWGTASALPVTLTFWVRSSVTGTYSGTLNNNAYDRSYIFTYTINSANTWEQKTVVVPGDTTGTWLKTNGNGMYVIWSLGCGSTYSSSTAGAWLASGVQNFTGAVNWIATSGATFYITGVQLEAGSVASPFERRDYGRELMMCQRYYWNTGTGQGAQVGAQSTATSCEFMFTHPVTMRAAPSLSYALIGNFASYLWNSGVSKTWTSAGSAFSTTRKCVAQISWSGASGLAGASAGMDANNSDFLAFSAEL